MFERLLTGVRTVVRGDGRTNRSPTSASNVEGVDTGGTDTEAATAGGTGRFYVCEACDTTFISDQMAECSKCGASVRAERRDAHRRDSFV